MTVREDSGYTIGDREEESEMPFNVGQLADLLRHANFALAKSHAILYMNEIQGEVMVNHA